MAPLFEQRVGGNIMRFLLGNRFHLPSRVNVCSTCRGSSKERNFFMLTSVSILTGFIPRKERLVQRQKYYCGQGVSVTEL